MFDAVVEYRILHLVGSNVNTRIQHFLNSLRIEIGHAQESYFSTFL